MKPGLSAKQETAFQAAVNGLSTEHVTTADVVFTVAVIGTAWVTLWVAWAFFSSYLSWAHQTQFQTSRHLVIEAVFAAFVALILMYVFI